MKKVSKLILLPFISLSLAACGAKDDGSSANSNNSSISEEKPWNDESSIKLQANSASIAMGDQYQIISTNVNLSQLTFTSLNPEVALVSSSGFITTVSEGDAVIKVATSSDFIFFKLHIGANQGISVSGVPLIKLSNNDLNLYIGEEYSISPKLYVDEDEVNGATFTYQLSENGIVSIENNKIKALASGSVTVTVNGNKETVNASKTFTVEVFNEITYLVPDFETREVVSGTPLKLKFALVNNSTMINEGVSEPTYTVSDSNLGVVRNGELFAVHKGFLTLTATVNYNSASYSCSVNLNIRELYKLTYTVEGTQVYEEYVASGYTIGYKQTPSKADSVFKCWADGENLVYPDTIINEAMDLEAKWLVYSSDISSEEIRLIWDYSTGKEIISDNGTGSYLWEDYQFPDTHINVQLTHRTLELTHITLPRMDYAVYPAVSFYFYITQITDAQFVYGSYTSATITKNARNQVSVIGNKLYFNGADTGQTISDEVKNAAEGLIFGIKGSTINTGKLCLTGFYSHLAEE